MARFTASNENALAAASIGAFENKIGFHFSQSIYTESGVAQTV
jgi:hypothetical protein